eukprot:4905372-Pleurochrysis_carterae.AAC.1
MVALGTTAKQMIVYESSPTPRTSFQPDGARTHQMQPARNVCARPLSWCPAHAASNAGVSHTPPTSASLSLPHMLVMAR